MVDLSGIAELKGIKRDGDKLVIGALAKHAEVANSPEVKAAIPALAMMAGTIGDTQVRNRGTIGGSVANNDPAADYPSAVLGLNATVVTDKRRIAADDFFQGMFTTALEPGELLVAIEFPIPEKAGYAKMRNPASRYVMAGVFVAKTKSGVRVVRQWRRPGRVPPVRHGEGAVGQLVGSRGRRDQAVGRWAERRHPWQRRIPRPPRHRDGEARRRRGGLNRRLVRPRGIAGGSGFNSPKPCAPGCRPPAASHPPARRRSA